jgi:hypothetical protein
VIARVSRYRVDDPEELLQIDAEWDGFRGREFYDLQPLNDPAVRIVIEVFRDQAAAEAAPRIPFRGSRESEELHFFFGGVSWHSPQLSEEHGRLLERLVPALAARLEPHLPKGWMAGRLRGYVRAHLEWSFNHFEELHTVDLADDAANAIRNLLHNMSEEIEDDTGEPWPDATSAHHVEAGQRIVRIWFGDRDQPVLALDPIPLDEIGL